MTKKTSEQKRNKNVPVRKRSSVSFRERERLRETRTRIESRIWCYSAPESTPIPPVTPPRILLLFFHVFDRRAILFLFLFLLAVSPFPPALVVSVVQLPFSVSKRRRVFQIVDVVREQREEQTDEEHDCESEKKVYQDLFLPLRVVFAFNSSFEC